MDSRTHPDVVRGQKASQLISDVSCLLILYFNEVLVGWFTQRKFLCSQKAYREDYEDEKSIIYYPYTITPEYDSKAAIRQIDVSNKYIL